MNTTPITEEKNNTPIIPQFTGFPLSPEVKEQISQDLDALEKNPINNWDKVYPTLFTMLNDTVQELCTKASCSRPGIVIRFKDRDSHQALAMILTNGSTQLHIGAELIRTFLLTPAPADALAMSKAFTWTLAHEIGHLSDSLFKGYAKAYLPRNVATRVANFCFFIGIANTISPGALTTFNGTNLLVGSLVFMCFQQLVTIFLHRQFEYRADNSVAQSTTENTSQDAKIALTTMTAAINTWDQQAIVLQTSLSKAIVKFKLWKLSFLHPTISERIARLKKNR